MEKAIRGYDAEAWNWDTQEVERFISNVEYLYIGCQGQSAEIIRRICIDYHIPGVKDEKVAWGELAEWFGTSEEPA